MNQLFFINGGTMKGTVAAAIAALFVLSCAGTGERKIEKTREAPKDTTITVRDDKYVVVNQDPIYVCKQNVKITWILDSNLTSQYEFHDDSIVIKQVAA